MAKARYYKADGKKGRARALPDDLFAAAVNEPVLHTVVTAHLANRRQGTGSAKNRARVRGGGRKPWRQKGTGRARQGTIRAPQWAGGGVAFPPTPHSWRQRVPKKVKALAKRSALSARAGEDRVILIDSLTLEKPATRSLVKYLEEIGLEGKVLLLTEGLKRNVVLSARNVPEVVVRPFGEESTYEILWSRYVVIERDAIEGSGAKQAEATSEADATDDSEGPADESGEEETVAVEEDSDA